MLRCLFIRRKLYDLVAGRLNAKERNALLGHLDRCAFCRKRAQEFKKLLGAVESNRQPPQPDEVFWSKFQAELNNKLDQELTAGVTSEAEPRREVKPGYLFRPVLAYASVLLFMLVAVFSLYRYVQPKIIAYQDQQIVEEILLLDEFNGTTILPLGDAYIQEMDILSRYGA